MKGERWAVLGLLVALGAAAAFLRMGGGPCGRVQSCCQAIVAGQYGGPRGDERGPVEARNTGGIVWKGLTDRCGLNNEGLLSRKECRALMHDAEAFGGRAGDEVARACAGEE